MTAAYVVTLALFGEWKFPPLMWLFVTVDTGLAVAELLVRGLS